MYQIDPGKLVIWRIGRPADIWLSQREVIAGMIAKYKLKPLDVESYPHVQVAAVAEAVEQVAAPAAAKTRAKALPISARLPWPKPFPGGLRIPHLHFGPDVYLLNRVQWREFSASVMRDMQERLGAAKELGFEQTMELSQAATTLG